MSDHFVFFIDNRLSTIYILQKCIYDPSLKTVTEKKDGLSIDPRGAKMLALCSNVPDSVPYLFERVDTDFAKKNEKFYTIMLRTRLIMS